MQPCSHLMSSFQPFALLLYGLSSVHGVLGLTTRYCLYFDNKELASNITSLALHFNFLMATILDHRLVFLPLSELTTTITTWASNRRVERGSRLVCVVPGIARLSCRCPGGTWRSPSPGPWPSSWWQTCWRRGSIMMLSFWQEDRG